MQGDVLAFVLLGAGVLLMLLEFGVPTEFDLFALGAGTFAAGLLLLLGLPLPVSVGIGLALAFAIVLASRYALRRIPTDRAFTPSHVVGQEGKVIGVEGDRVVVRVAGEDWLAESGEPLQPGARIRVVKQEGNRLFVVPLKPDPSGGGA